jgi:L-asparaginase II
VVVRRGSILESRHHVRAALADAEGRLLASAGDAAEATAFRSSAKPFQLLPFVERGLAERWSLNDEQLAVMAASHSGSDTHVELVRGLLTRFGIEERHLACGVHDPLDPEALASVRRDPTLATVLHNNCSGKHAGMLAMCVAEGWPLAGYERPDHPLQRLMRATVGEVCGVDSTQIALGVDGCSVPVFGVSLVAMATGFARLAAARGDGPPRERALARIRTAMGAFPYAVGGRDRFDTDLMAATGGRMVAKVGAEGLECVAISERGWGLAVKADDGNGRATAPATLAILESLDLLSEAERATLAAQRRPVIRNVRGLEVGLVDAEARRLDGSRAGGRG